MEQIHLFLSNIYIYLAIIVALVPVGVLIFVRKLRYNDDYWKERGVPYVPRSSIFTLFRMLAKLPIHDLIQMNYKKYGKIYGGFEFSKPILTVADPELLRQILVKDFNNFNFTRENTFKEPLIKNMVSVLKGEDWKRVRTVITPAFTAKQMRKMGNIINTCTESVLETIEKHSRAGESVDFKTIFGAFSFDVIASAAFATKIDSINDPENIFVKTMRETFQEMHIFRLIITFLMPQRLLIWLRLGGLNAMDFFKKVIMDVIDERRRTNQRYNDILQLLMDAVEGNKLENSSEDIDDVNDQYGSITNAKITSEDKYKKLTEDELISQCVMFFLVGFETTSSALTFLAYALASNQDWQEKLAEEVDDSFQKHGEMSYDAVRDMKILDAIVSETLRMYPAGILTQRTALEDYKLGNTGITIEKGMAVYIPIYGMHYDPDFFDEPEKFNPERFIDTEKYSHPQYAYLPFGAGPRNCLGMRFALLEIKLCIANIIRHYKFKVASNTEVPPVYKKISQILGVNKMLLAVEKRTNQL